MTWFMAYSFVPDGGFEQPVSRTLWGRLAAIINARPIAFGTTDALPAAAAALSHSDELI
jgi:hypothetical protein